MVIQVHCDGSRVRDVIFSLLIQERNCRNHQIFLHCNCIILVVVIKKSL